ncbi:MAG: C-GCAxxG-C-C family protein [Clostridium sp.]|jgi:C_GCAxxG_C_C family probable redox protein|uniref:C-GCAxxG-C-C family (seleno)protein n=1 Tax=Clostridium sp. TaxID=1506 RepID=UPI0025BD5AA8|nr:C-GCAxxG-C-C family (seleno)protein [Clostridium sp.]MCH3965958.1 C-GCAxxG-C-C family protein [Clostridium sp.]MCI1715953.1 C-GCAxxG-C-C family protein [Clostridium sp.]MCI1800375.1 C-GCAxxG-C-C family protein [Clostridium sp.]MCI1814130.1 C-GCAxxG-C-C family protein [Clostridium sp.]MCI1871029.1 C-GCAxxG-C-C family protein [Clostridium sp.]
MKKVLEFHKEGYNCAESIVKAINEEKETNIPVSIASPFGSGMTVGTTCGAVTGALMALGSIKGRETSKESNETREITKEVMNRVKEKYGTFECSKLKKKGISCDEIIEYTYEILRECLK